MSAPPTDAVDLLRFLALSLEVHTDAVCCAVDDVEASIVESSINDERMDRLEEELARLLDRQRRLHAARDVIARSQEERRRGRELRRLHQPTSEQWGEKRIQTSRSSAVAGSSAVAFSTTSSIAGGTSASLSVQRPPIARTSSPASGAVSRTGGADADDDDDGDGSTRCLSTVGPSLAPSVDADVAALDREVELLKAKIEELDCFSLRGKLLQLERMKRAVKDIDVDAIIEDVVDRFEFPPAVQSLWSPTNADRSAAASMGASPSVSRTSGTPLRDRRLGGAADVSLAQHAAGRSSLINHTTIDLVIARACQRLTGRCVDALEALATTSVSEDSAAAHVLGCSIYAAEFEKAEWGELKTVMELQRLAPQSLTRLYHQLRDESICTAKLDAQCFGARGTVLAAQDFNALPADWATARTLSQVPLASLLPPVRHLLCPRFTFANAQELKALQTARVALQRKIVDFLVGGQATHEELLGQLRGSAAEHAVASARLAVAETTPDTLSPHAWRTMVRVPDAE